jgi:hypothetical protein
MSIDGARMPTLTEDSWISMPSCQRHRHWEVVQRLVLEQAIGVSLSSFAGCVGAIAPVESVSVAGRS